MQSVVNGAFCLEASEQVSCCSLQPIFFTEGDGKERPALGGHGWYWGTFHYSLVLFTSKILHNRKIKMKLHNTILFLFI